MLRTLMWERFSNKFLQTVKVCAITKNMGITKLNIKYFLPLPCTYVVAILYGTHNTRDVLKEMFLTNILLNKS